MSFRNSHLALPKHQNQRLLKALRKGVGRIDDELALHRQKNGPRPREVLRTRKSASLSRSFLPNLSSGSLWFPSSSQKAGPSQFELLASTATSEHGKMVLPIVALELYTAGLS